MKWARCQLQNALSRTGWAFAPHLRRNRHTSVVRVGVVSLAVVLAFAGCGSSKHHFSVSVGAPSLATTCGALPHGLTAKTYWLETSDGVRIYAAAAGRGPTAVALVHESGAGICGWLPTMQWLAAKGLRPVAIALRGYPPSAEPRDAIYHHYTQDIHAGVQRERGESGRGEPGLLVDLAGTRSGDRLAQLHRARRQRPLPVVGPLDEEYPAGIVPEITTTFFSRQRSTQRTRSARSECS